MKTLEVNSLQWKKGETETAKSARAARIIVWIVILASIAMILVYVKDAVAQTYFQSGINSSVVGDISGARMSFDKALSLRQTDTYYQALAQIDAFDINSIISTATSASSTAIATIGSLINEGIGYARSGQYIDSANANNYLAEGDISEIAAAINVPNAYGNAKIAYARALSLSPLNPAIYLSLARLEYLQGSTTAAENDINAALQLKPDYTDALFEAGVISYNEKNYQVAAQAFTAVLKVDKSYSNAEYFLGLTFARANDTADAITVFGDMAKQYPNNTTIAAILADLQSGKSIFADADTQAAQTPVTPLSPPKPSTKTSTKTTKTDKTEKSSSTTTSSGSTTSTVQ